MNGSKIVAGPAKPRYSRTIKVAPVTRAVRAALAMSVTAMALTGTGVAYAGTCTPPSSNTIYCDGSFLNTITFPDVDLTLVVGQNAPTSVTPGTGSVGIEADWPGDVMVINFADITTAAADGIHAYGSSSAQVFNYGSVVTAATGPAPAPVTPDSAASAFITPPGAIAIDTVAYGDATVVNGGYAGAFATGVYDVTAVLAESTGIGYTATVDNLSSGAIFAFTDGSGTALGIEAYAANGNVDVSNDGLLVAVSYYGIADGAFAAGQSVSVSSSNQIYSIGYSWSAGIEAEGSDLTTVNNSGLIYSVAAGAYGHAFGVYAAGGAGGTKVYNSGTIDVRGPYATGIQAQGNGGGVSVFNFYGGNLTVGNSFTSYYATGISAATNYDNSNILVSNAGGITALSAYGSNGILAVATGAGSTVNVGNSGDIYVSTASKYGTSIGIGASGDGNTGIYTGGTITVADGGTSYGALALSFNGNASVNNYGKVDVHAADYVGSGFGLVASSANGTANVYNTGTVQVTAGYSAIGIEAGSLTGTSVRNNGTVTVDAFKYGYGVVATAGQGDVSIYNGGRGSVDVHSDYGSAFGLVGVSTQGNVSVNNNGTVSTDGFYQATGVFARADDGNVSVGNSGSINATSYLDSATGIAAIASNGDVSVFAGGSSNIQAYSAGNTAIGIEAVADDGGATIYNYGAISATAGQNPYAMNYSGALGVADGIFASAQTVRVGNGSTINATGYGWAAGIEAQGSYSTSVSNNGSITATSTGSYSHAFGMYTTGGAGGVRDYNTGTMNVQGSYAIGIEAQTANGGISIGNSGDIVAGNTGRTYYATGIDAATNYAANNIYINNSGSVVALSYFGSTGIAAVATGAGSTALVRNSGDVYVTTASKYGTSMGIVVSSDGNSTAINTGSVTVSYGGNSYGVSALSFDGNALAYNGGDISVTGGLVIGSGSGLVASSANQSAFADNNGTISVDAGYYGFGIQASGLTGSFVGNYGSVGVQTKYGYGYGILATSGQGYAAVRNTGAGTVDVQSTYGTALGLVSVATQGYASVFNSGSVTANGYLGAIGAAAIANAGNATVISNGDLSAISTLGTAIGLLGHGYGTASASNGGDLVAYSLGNDAIGVEAVSDNGVVLLNNTGTIAVDGGVNAAATQYTGAVGLAEGMLGRGESIYARNDGGIDATGYGWAAGIETFGGNLTRVYNTGTISATSIGVYGYGVGIYAFAGVGGVRVNTSGDIAANGTYAAGIHAYSSNDVNVYNGGDIAANGSMSAIGINAISSNSANSAVFVGNGGSIAATSGYGSTGIEATATGAYSTAFVANIGDVYVDTLNQYISMGILASASGDAGIYNRGSVTVAYGGASYGETAISFNGNASVTNLGDVTVNAAPSSGLGIGIRSSAATGSARVDNSGAVTVYGGFAATGIQVISLTQSVAVNGGSVAVTTGGYGHGILASAGNGYVLAYNNGLGSVDVTSYGGNALGITGIAANGNVLIYNAGSISATGYADAIGAMALANNGQAAVISSGDISAASYIAPAIGVLASATGGNSYVRTDGSISATSQGEAAIGIEGLSDTGAVTINSASDITVTGGASALALRTTGALGLAEGIFGAGQTVAATNNGSIYASGYGWAAGIEAQGVDQTTVYNRGSITAISTGSYSHAFGLYATGGANGVFAYNGGDITALGSYAMGIQAQSSGGIVVVNSGDIAAGDAYGSYYATGINAATNYANSNISVTSSGSIAANSYFGSTGIAAVATGAGSNGSITNSGSVYVNTTGKYSSTGLVVSADLNATVYNTGSVTVNYGGSSYGAMALAFNGNASVTNLGSVDVTGAGLIGYGFGLVSSSSNAAAGVYNRGSVTVYAGYSAMGIQAASLTGTTVNNAGSVAVDTFKYGYGILATAGQGDVAISNGGSVDVYSYAGSALGITGIATVGDVLVQSSGSVYASGYLDTIGIFARSHAGNTLVDSSGDITAFTYISPAIGVLAHATGGDSAVYNSGSISATSLGEAAIGIEGLSDTGAVTISNSGDITAVGDASALVTSYTGSIGAAQGIYANGLTVGVASNGSIDATGYAFAAGIEARSTDSASVNNGGSIAAATSRDYSATYGALVLSGGDVYFSNSGSISATATGASSGAFGVLIQSYGNVTATSSGSVTALGTNAGGVVAQASGNVVVSTAGDITVGDLVASNYASGVEGISSAGNVSIQSASAIDVEAALLTIGINGFSSLGDVAIGNSGSVYVRSGQTALGIYARTLYGNAAATNTGGIAAYGVGATSGMLVRADHGTATATNSGAVSATSSAGDSYGIEAVAGQGDVSISNGSAGVVNATSYAGPSWGIAGITTVMGDVSIGNAGTVDVNATNQAIGIEGLSAVGNDVSIGNTGNVYAHADLSAMGIYARVLAGDATVSNGGQIGADGNTAIGVRVANAVNGNATVSNGGDIHADGDDSGLGILAITVVGATAVNNSGTITGYSAYGFARGVVAYSQYGSVAITNSGDITADAAGALGAARGVQAAGGTVSVTNSGTIAASSDSGVGAAIGVQLTGAGDAHLGNTGSISATNGGAGYAAIGVTALSYGGAVTIDNAGTITATDSNYAVAVSMNAALGSLLTNTGTIGAYSALEGNIAVNGGNGVENILNYGYVHGAIVTRDGDDMLFNGTGGVWMVDNHSTDFGAGDDHVINGAGGTIQLYDAAIYLGSSAGSGNSFVNNGTIKVSGDSLIDMGTGSSGGAFAPTLVPSLNPLPLVNNGIIDFRDGAPDDVLTIVGDLGGNGAIDLDVSLLNGTSDLLYVDGSIANGSAQTVNVVLDQLPTDANTFIPFAHVTGNSVDGSFVPGTFTAGNVINYDPSNFLSLQLDVTSQIDPSNATDDVFSIGLAVTGLNDTGTLAASIASGVQSLVNSQIGTWRQRMGVLPPKGENDAGLSPWFRVISDRGEVDPAHVAANFGQGGNFRFDQSNTGQEVGMNVRPGDRFNFGLLVAKSEGSQHLVAPGIGSDRIKTNAVGLYGTWISPKGYYVDASYRWIDFDAVLRSAAGEQTTKGYAGAWNLEAGYDAWTLSGGLKITPQIQYTRTHVGDIDAIVGAGAAFAVNGGDSSRGRLGVEFSKAINSDSGFTWTPYGSINAVREFNGKTGYSINNAFFGATSIEGTSAMVELGLGAQKGGFSITGGVNWTDGGALKSFEGGQLELRYSW